MDYLIRFVERNEQVRSAIERATEYPSVQGVVLEIDPIWLKLWRLKETFGEDMAQRIINNFDFFSPFNRYSWLEEFTQNSPYWIPRRPLDEESLSWRPENSNFYYRELWGRQYIPELPLILKICLYPTLSEEQTQVPDFPSVGIPIIYETRPPAVLSANPKKSHRPILGGVSIGVGQDVGTLGGILKCSTSGKYYGLTCAHVTSNGNYVDQPAQVDGTPPSQIGKVSHFSTLNPSMPNIICNPYMQSFNLNEIDAALIELHPVIQSQLKILQIGQLTGITPKARLTPGQAVELTGRTSGYRTLEIGGLGICYKFQGQNNNTYCFRNLIELRYPSGVIPSISSPIQGGDSGAWVCIPSGQGYEFSGMVIGEDRRRGYAIFSEVIEDWWKSQGLILTVN
jgi:hypothetical protein